MSANTNADQDYCGIVEVDPADFTNTNADVAAMVTRPTEMLRKSIYDLQCTRMTNENLDALDALLQSQQAEITRLSAMVEEKDAALAWYAEQVEGCRKLGSIGDPSRRALDADGGERARQAISTQGPTP